MSHKNDPKEVANNKLLVATMAAAAASEKNKVMLEKRGEYDPRVEAAISNCFPSNDQLAVASFDPIEYINTNFPDEASLFTVDSFMNNLTLKVHELDSEIFEAIRHQAITAKTATQDIEDSKATIHELFVKVKDIKEKADQSEVMVQEICSDIRRLDSAKRNLTATKNALTRVSMFLTAVEQLEDTVTNRKYREAANLLMAVNDVSKHFDGYEKTVPKIRELKASVARTRDALTKQIFEYMEGIGDNVDWLGAGTEYDNDDTMPANPNHNNETLAGAFLVADALGPEVRRSLRRTIVLEFMKPYDSIFRPGEKFSDLENINRRFTWFARLSRRIRKNFANIIPLTWRFDEHMALEFANRTNSQLNDLLKNSPNQMDVGLLVHSLRTTKEFETKVDKVTRVDYLRVENLRNKKNTVPTAVEEDMAERNSNSGTVINATAKNASQLLDEFSPPLSLSGVISSVFERYLNVFVHSLSDNINDSVLQEITKEKSVGPEQLETILPSSNTLFLGMRQATHQLVEFNSGQTYFDLFLEIKRLLADYARSLENRLPPTGPKGDTNIANYKRLDSKGILATCQIISTAEHCAERVTQFEQSMKSRIDAQFQDQINLEDEQDMFYKTINVSVQNLIRGLEARLEPFLVIMTKKNWETFDNPGDQSEYISRISGELREYFTEVRPRLTQTYFRNFHDKFAESFLPHYRNALIRCRRIGELGARQLLVDTSALKSIMVNLPEFGRTTSDYGNDDDGMEESTPIGLETYRKFASKSMLDCEVLLKLVGMNTPNDLLVENFRLLWPDGTLEDLEEVLDLRGVKKPAIRQDIIKQARVAGIPKRSATQVYEEEAQILAAVKSSREFSSQGTGTIFGFGRGSNAPIPTMGVENIFTSVRTIGGELGSSIQKTTTATTNALFKS